MSKRIEQLIVKAGLAINNSLQNTELQPIFTEYGYPAEKLAQGKSLLDSAYESNNGQAKEYGDKFQATNELEEKRDIANKDYMRLVKIARVALAGEHAAWQALGLGGDRKQSNSGWLVQCTQFFTNLKNNAGWLSKMGTYGITSEKLAASEALLKQAEEAFNKQKTETGEAQEATRLRDESIDELQSWYSDFIAIARIALEDKPQYLEMLGVVER